VPVDREEDVEEGFVDPRSAFDIERLSFDEEGKALPNDRLFANLLYVEEALFPPSNRSRPSATVFELMIANIKAV
jgi:hypothetical protein